MLHKYFAKIVGLLLSVELISWLAYSNSQFELIAFVLLVVIIFGLSLYRLEYGIYSVVAELVIGSHGYMLSFPIGSFNVSIRLVMFLVVFIAWVINIARKKKVLFFHSNLWKWYIALFTFLGIGVLVGYLNGNSINDIFFDLNGYLYMGMILPFSQAIRDPKHVRKLITVLFAGVTILAIKTIVILFLFSHGDFFEFYLSSVYKWIRDFRIGEITLQPNGFYRIFFQSHIYVLYSLLISLALIMKKIRWQYMMILGISVTLLFLSYSRSFWVALVLLLSGSAVYWAWKQRVSLQKIAKIYGMIAILFIVGYLGALGIINVPLSLDAGSGVSAGSLLADRTQDPTTEAAGGSRMALLKPLLSKNIEHPLLGSGFGTTVTYKTQDPRALESNQDGLYTTFAFEWGYLDLWLKLGLAGTVVYLAIIWILIHSGYSLGQKMSDNMDKYMVIGVTLSVVALALVHALTPYLNHPLGIGWIVIATVILDIYIKPSHAKATS